MLRISELVGDDMAIQFEPSYRSIVPTSPPANASVLLLPHTVFRRVNVGEL